MECIFLYVYSETTFLEEWRKGIEGRKVYWPYFIVAAKYTDDGCHNRGGPEHITRSIIRYHILKEFKYLTPGKMCKL